MKKIVNQIKSENESKLCLISSEALDFGVCYATILKTHVGNLMHTSGTSSKSWTHEEFDNLQFVGIFGSFEF